MNTLDIALVVVIAIGFIYGYCKGLIKQLTFGAGIVLGLLQAMLFYPVVGEWIRQQTDWNEMIAVPAAFIAILTAVVIMMKIAGVVLSGILKMIHLGFIDRTLGALFSSIIAIFVFVGIVRLTNSIVPDNRYTCETSQKESLLYKRIEKFTFLVIGEAKEKIDEKKEQHI